jgi:hypothetical protein
VVDSSAFRVLCSERADVTGSHSKAKKELQDMAEAMKVCWARHKCHRAWRPAAVLAPSFDQNDLQLLHNPWLQHSTNVLTVGKTATGSGSANIP